jgi:hypothetical protein
MFKFSFSIWIFLINISSFSQTVQLLPEKEFSGSQTQKWSEVQGELGKLKTKVDAQNVVVNELLKSKKNHEAKMSVDDIEKLKKEHAKLKSLTTDYNEMLSDFQFRFPEKGLESGRKYIRLENQTLEQMEKSPTLEGRLKKLQKKIKKQYQAEDSAVDDPKKLPTYKSKKIPVGSKGLDSVKPLDSDVTDQINLVK